MSWCVGVNGGRCAVRLRGDGSIKKGELRWEEGYREEWST